MRTGTTTVRYDMPCHPALARIVLTGFDYHGPRQVWEQTCPRCGTHWRFHNLRGVRRHAGERVIWWWATDRLADPGHPQQEPLDAFTLLMHEHGDAA